MHTENENYKQNDQGNEDPNYLAVEGNIVNISRRLLNALVEDDIHVSGCNILTIFNELSVQTLYCYGYTHAKNNFHDGFPGYDETKKRWAAVEQSGGWLHMHLELFRDVRTSQDETNIYKVCLQDMMHEYTADKMVVLGMNVFSTTNRTYGTLGYESEERKYPRDDTRYREARRPL